MPTRIIGVKIRPISRNELRPSAVDISRNGVSWEFRAGRFHGEPNHPRWIWFPPALSEPTSLRVAEDPIEPRMDTFLAAKNKLPM